MNETNKEIDAVQKQPTDTEMLDWLQENTRGYGTGWICRTSYVGRGMRLHETNMDGTSCTVREAIAKAMETSI